MEEMEEYENKVNIIGMLYNTTDIEETIDIYPPKFISEDPEEQ